MYSRIEKFPKILDLNCFTKMRLQKNPRFLLTLAVIFLCQEVMVNAEHQQQKRSLLRRKLQDEPQQQEDRSEADVLVIDSNTTNKIIGGTASTATYPYFGYWDRGCGASLIAPDIMLTAAHCTRGQFTTNGKVYFGSLNLEQGAALGVVDIIAHPRYNPTTENRDYALLKLSGRAPSGSSPIRLNRNGARPAAGFSNLLVMGFGMTDANVEVRSPVLQEVKVVAEDNTCRNAYPSRFDPEVMMCAAQTNKDACQGVYCILW